MLKEQLSADSKQFYHEDEGSSVDNVTKVADDVVYVFKDSPRTRTAIVAVALYVLLE